VINLENNDDAINQFPLRITEIIAAVQKGGAVNIMVNNEGPDLERIGLYTMLDRICSEFQYDKKGISIHTRNLLERHSEYTIVIHPPYTFIQYCQDYVAPTNIQAKDISKYFGMFVGRSNWQRLWLASHLYSSHQKSSLLTYHYDHQTEYHGANLGLDTLIAEAGPEVLPDVGNLLATTPILYDSIDGYPIDGRKKTVPSLDLAPRYREFFLEIVAETYTAGKSFFPTEKTWRPIMCKTPFIIQGPQWFLANLRALGIKTFDRWWDENYDWQPGKTKIQEIIKVIDFIAEKSDSDLKNMYNEMLPTLEHNYNVLMNLTEQQLLSATYVQK
jgi:hypothetical protein